MSQYRDERGEIVIEFRNVVKDGEKKLSHIPYFLKRVIELDAWRAHISGSLYQNATFKEFLTAKPSKGCGFDDIGMVEALIKKSGDEDAMKLFRSAVKGKLRVEANRPKKEDKCSGEHLPTKRGDNNEYWQAVIERDAPELLPKIGKGSSARKVATDAGLRVEKTTIEKLQDLWRKATDDERAAFREYIDTPAMDRGA